MLMISLLKSSIIMINRPNIIQLSFFLLVSFSSSYSNELLTEPNDFEMLDRKIQLFLKSPTKEGWEDNLKEIDLFLQSMRNMVMVLNGTLPGLTKETLTKIELFHRNEKPAFIDTNVVEYELQPVIKVSDEDFNRLCRLRVTSQLVWEHLCDMFENKEKYTAAVDS